MLWPYLLHLRGWHREDQYYFYQVQPICVFSMLVIQEDFPKSEVTHNVQTTYLVSWSFDVSNESAHTGATVNIGAIKPMNQEIFIHKCIYSNIVNHKYH